jgi:hypothetical protein
VLLKLNCIHHLTDQSGKFQTSVGNSSGHPRRHLQGIWPWDILRLWCSSAESHILVPSSPCLACCSWRDSRLLSLRGQLSKQVSRAISQQPCQAVRVVHSEGWKTTAELLVSQMTWYLQEPWPQDLLPGCLFKIKWKPDKQVKAHIYWSLRAGSFPKEPMLLAQAAEFLYFFFKSSYCHSNSVMHLALELSKGRERPSFSVCVYHSSELVESSTAQTVNIFLTQ